MRTLLCVALLGCGASASRPPLQLRRVILYQNGIGYFERTGLLAGQALHLQVARPELDDVLKTLTVVDRLGGSVATVDVPVIPEGARTVGLDVRLGAGRAHDLLVGYAVPTPTWKAAYRVVLDDTADAALIQGWAMVNNTSQDDWRDVSLTLATGAPMSLALDLSKPEYVKRPDATGRLVAPTILGPVGGERTVAQDRDGDGLLDATDRCPDAAEDRDGALDDDGCPDPDLDRDAIADRNDRCPGEPETYNGFEDDDGCPDRGSVVIRSENRTGSPARTPQPAAPRLDAASLGASTRARAKPVPVAGTVRYALSEPVSIRRGASAMVSILNQRVPGHDVFLYRPDGNAPGSDRHPFRAVKLVNRSGYTLEPGPIAIFAGGSFVGDSLVERISVDETAWIPYALDGGTQVTVARRDDEQPVRLVSIQRGIVTVENAGIRATTYTVAAGRDTSRTIYLRHARAGGFTARDLPPGTIDQGDAYLVPLPLAAAKTASLTIEERQPRRRTIALAAAGHLELGGYVEHAPAAVIEQLRAAIALRRELAGLEEQLAGLRARVVELADRGHELRESLRTLERVRNVDDLRKKLVDGLARATAESDAVARALGEKAEAIAAMKSRLADAIRELTLDGSTD